MNFEDATATDGELLEQEHGQEPTSVPGNFNYYYKPSQDWRTVPRIENYHHIA